MTDRDALLAAVLATPHDDTPRKVFADYLDERGEPERAEFVRVQCELADLASHCETSLACAGCVYDRCKRYDALRRRERGLWCDWSWKWFDVFGRSPWPTDTQQPTNLHWTLPCGEIRAFVRRGFIDEIRLPLAAFVGGPCGRATCHGGRIMTNAHGSRKCPGCSGTGRVGGLAGRLFAAHPVTKVVLPDRTPYFWNGRAFWGRSTWATTDALPDEIYSLLPDQGLSSNRGSMKGFPDCEAASAALNAVCIEYGRSLVDWIAEHDRKKGLVTP